MVLLLRCCILNQRKLFRREVISFKRTFMYCMYSSVKKLTPVLQIRYFSTESSQNEERELIYTGSLSARIRNIKVFSFLTTFGSIMFQPFLYMRMMEDDQAASIASIFVVINLVTMTSPIILHWVARRYVLQIYKYPKEEKYTAVTYSLFFKRNELTFTPNDVVEVSGALTACHIKGKPLIFHESQFINPQHYFIIMGYNKPIDFKMEKLNVTSVNRITADNKNIRQIENK